MFNKKSFIKKQNLKDRCCSIVTSDRNNDENKRINQKINKLNIAFNNLHKSMLDFGYSYKNAIDIFNKNINNIARS